MTTTNRDVVLSYLRAFSSGDPETIAAHVTEDFHNRQMGLLGTGCRGADTYRERLKGFLGAFRNLEYEVEDLVEGNDKVAVAYRMTFEDRDRPVAVQGVMIIKLRDSLIAERADYWDGLSYLKQTGIGL